MRLTDTPAAGAARPSEAFMFRKKLIIACLLCTAGLTMTALIAQDSAVDPSPVQKKIAEQETRTAPRLMRTTYTAKLIGNSLVGTGKWSIHHSAVEPAALPLPFLSLALSNARNITENRPAILGNVDGENLGLLVLKPGLQTIAFDWSASRRPEPWRVPLRFAPAPLFARQSGGSNCPGSMS